MKLIIFTAIMFLSVSIAKGQQQLSYSYDAASNRTKRTVVVGAQNLSMGNHKRKHTILTLGDKQVSITSESRASKGKYSISNRDCKILTSRDLHTKTIKYY